jgi:predicted O-methyltransferase YrrM
VPDLATIPGWLDSVDEELLRFFLRTQVELGESGDLAELGVFMGRSAVVLGDYIQPGETFTVIDLFEQPATDDANRDENLAQYPNLTQREFERHYLRFHSALPTVVRGYSQTITEYAPHGTHRLLHIDASHLYEHVLGDIAAAKTLLSPTGIVVFDDIRELHTPGVAAAVWGEVATGGLHPLAMTYNKLYATWGEPGLWQKRLAEWPDPWAKELQNVAGVPMLRFSYPPPSLRRRVVVDITPPVLVRWIDRSRARARNRLRAR